MQLINIFVLSVVTLGLYFNLNKFNIMINCYKSQKVYNIFPWSDQPQISNSHPLWLIIHLVSSLFHICLVGLIIMRKDLKSRLKTIYSISHTLFLFLIILNLQHLGNNSAKMSMIINGVTVVCSSMTYHSEWKNKDSIYFAIITIPILFEFAKYISQYTF